MIKSRKKIAAVVAALTLAAALSGCSGSLGGLDVVGQQSIASFDEVLKAVPESIAADETNAGWSLAAPDGSARFIWSGDYSKSSLHDVMLEVDAAPFLAAGLDPAKLPEHYAYFNDDSADMKEGATLMVGKKLGAEGIASDPGKALAAYELIVDQYRDFVNYHTSLDHYGVMLGDGNMFEWAKDMKINGYDGSNQDKDIVFVLNPEPLIAAGVDPQDVEGWVYAQVSVEENGKTIEVWKLLKPFDIVK